MMPIALSVFLWIITRTFYRVTSLGAENVPVRGGALLVSNHVSLVDLLLILACSRRFIRFLLPQGVCAKWWLKPCLRYLRVIPLPPEQQARELVQALQQAHQAIQNGELVGVFAEKSVSRIGVMLPFRQEFECIMEGVEAPIIPVCLDGLWGSIFSHEAGRFFWKIPRRIPYPVTVAFGEPLSARATAFEVRNAIQALGTEAWWQRRRIMRTLGLAFVWRARRCPFRLAMADARAPRLTFVGTLLKTVFLTRRLRPLWAAEKRVGIFLPPSVGGALVNLAALLAGKIPVNLNYTLSAETLGSCIRQSELQCIVTSKLFLERMKASLPGRVILLEEVATKPGLPEKLAALALACFAPVRWLEKAAGCAATPQLDDPATVIFSSGSTGEPKGIVLSHYNLMSNIAQLGQTFDFNPDDRFVGILPFFHSFGFTATLLVPAVYGTGVVFHPNPTDGKAIGELVRRYALTYLMATPAFLQIYLRTCDPGDFGSLRLVMAGAEKLSPQLALAFEEKFGLGPVEGYGCTECSPVVAANTHDFRAAGYRQTGSHRGKVGRPMPGMSVSIVDLETREPLRPGQSGLLLVRGPNVMQGYLGRADKTAEVLHNGWYETGDVAILDEEGFLQITDRLSRFSKIGGEMVPHVKVEEKLQQLAGRSELTFVVAGVPDAKKGERLVVLHTLNQVAAGELLKRLSELDLPNLWIPKASEFFAVTELPNLASGKLDLRKVREIALRLSQEREAQRTPTAYPPPTPVSRHGPNDSIPAV